MSGCARKGRLALRRAASGLALWLAASAAAAGPLGLGAMAPGTISH